MTTIYGYPVLKYTYSSINGINDASVNGISNYATETWTDTSFNGTLTIPDTTTDSNDISYNVVGINYGVFWVLPDFQYSEGDASANFNANYRKITTIIITSNITQINFQAFAGLSNLSYVTSDTSYNSTYSTFPIGVTSLTDGVLGGTAITSFIIPYSVTSIGSQTFYGCTSLTNLKIYSTSLSLSIYGSFQEVLLSYLLCTSSSGLSYTYPLINNYQDPTTIIQTFYNSSSIPPGWVLSNDNTYPDISYNIADSSAYISSIDNWYTSWSTFTDGTITIPDTVTISNTIYDVTDISGSSFSYSSVLYPNTISASNLLLINEIDISNNVTTIGNYAFSDLTSLTTVTLSNNLTTLGEATFYGCSSLTSITIPATVTEINLYTFSGCSSLASLEILGSSVTIDSSSNESANPFYDTSLNYLLCTNSSGSYTYGLTIPTDPTTIIQTFYNSSSAPSGWISTTGYSSYPKYVYSNSDALGGSGMSFTTSYNSTDASNTYITSTYGNVAINALSSTNSIYLGRTDCSSNVNNNLGNTINDVYVGGNLNVDSSLNVGGNLNVDGSLNVGGLINLNTSALSPPPGFQQILFGSGRIDGDWNTATGVTITFSTPFLNTPTVVAVGEGNGKNYQLRFVCVQNITTTQFVAYGMYYDFDNNVRLGGVTFYWIAIG
jgi:hypothetical protein